MHATALTLTPAETTATAKMTDSIAEVLESTRSLVETTAAAMETLDGKAKNDVAGALAKLMEAVAKRIENN